MNKFITHGTNETRTENGKLAYKSTLNACLDLFYLINASRGQNLSAKFTAAYKEDKETALGILLYSRDIRGGQGERQQFRDIIAGNIKLINRAHLKALANAVPEVGRFDDLKVFIDEGSKTISDHAIDLWVDAIKNGNYLAAKWCPSTSRKGAAPFRKKFGMRLDKDWRKFLSEMAKANTVENIVLNTKNYAAIDYSKLPSKALNRWRKNFLEHDNERFQDFLSAITKGEAKVNASTLYPYEVYNNLNGTSADRKLAEAQWKA